jgi:hypothetical protein
VKRKINLAVSWLLGFALLVNLYLLPMRVQTPVLTDLLGAGLGVWMLYKLCTRGLSYSFLYSSMLISLFPIIWIIVSGLMPYPQTLVLSIRWLLSIPWAFALIQIIKDVPRRQSFLWGMWWGIWVNVGIMGAQYLGYTELTQDFGMAARDLELTYVYGTFRTPGMHGHANGAAATVSLIIPVSIYLYAQHKRLGLILVAAFIALAASSQLSSTRSALIVGVIMALLFFMKSLNSRRVLISMVGLGIITSVGILIWGLPGGWLRWQDQLRTSQNFNERLISTTNAFRLSLENPLGLGIESAKENLYSNIGINATHNAFLHVGLIYGIFQGALLLISFIVSALLFYYKKNSYQVTSLLALHMIGLFFFEEHINNQVFLILSVWISISVIQMLFSYRTTQTAAKKQQVHTPPIKESPQSTSELSHDSQSNTI